MAKLPSVFNAKKHVGRMGFNVIPEGWYKMMITKSEMKKNKSNEGSHLLLLPKVVEGQHKGATVFVRLNLQNSNSSAVEIAQNELGSICDACGLGEIKDSNELHGVEFWGEVKIEEGTGGYSDSNRVVKYAKNAPKGVSSPSSSESSETSEKNSPF